MYRTLKVSSERIAHESVHRQEYVAFNVLAYMSASKLELLVFSFPDAAAIGGAAHVCSRYKYNMFFLKRPCSVSLCYQGQEVPEPSLFQPCP